MKKTVFLIGAVVWTVIAIAAIAVLVVALSGSSQNLPGWMRAGSIVSAWDANTALIKEESFSLLDITELDIGTQYQSIVIVLSDSDEMTVRHYDIDSATPFVSEISNGRLSISAPNRGMVTLGMANPRLEIDLPRSYSDAVSLRSSSGSIGTDGSVGWSVVSIASSSGTVRLGSGLTCGDLNISTSSGSIQLGDTQADRIEIVSSSGTQRLGDLRALGDVKLTSTSGSISSGDIAAPNLSIQSSSGTIRIGNVDVDGHLDISSSTGSQNAGVVKTGTFNISSNSGTLRYEGLSGAGSLRSSSGSINCEALDVGGDVSVTSTSGTQRITLAPNQNFEIEIFTSSGTIRASNLELLYSDNRGQNAFGRVGSGSGGTLSLQSSSGSININ